MNIPWDEEEYAKHRGQLLQIDKTEVTQLPLTLIDNRETLFVISAGSWPNRHAHAVQAQCDFCEDPCGISPKGWKLKQENPKRPIVCPSCFGLMQELEAMGALEPES